MILCEASLKSWMRAEYVLKVLDDPAVSSETYLRDIVSAARNAQNFKDVCRFLRQDCEICFSDYPTRMVGFSFINQLIPTHHLSDHG